MGVLEAIFLGTIQGFTEFLPISSSAHLVIIQHFLPGFTQSGVLFDVILHAGTLLAVIIYFRRDIWELTLKKILLLIIATIPAGIVGVAFMKFLEGLFKNVRYVGFELLVNAVMNFWVDKIKTKNKEVGTKEATIIGIAQAISISPGISRSGSTIFAGTVLGINREEIANFSFLMSIPSVGGAIFLEVMKHGATMEGQILPYLAGFIASFIFGFISIKTLLTFLKTKNFKVFGIYCLILGILVITLV